MYVVVLSYTKPLDAIDALMEQHVAFLRQCFRAGVFLAAGRQVPREGGVILACSPTREDLEDVLAHPLLAQFADAGTRAVADVPDPGA